MAERPRTLLTGAQVLDGTGRPADRAVIAIRGDRIAGVAPRIDAGPDDVVVDLAGWTVAPGFIDMHSHSDLRILLDPACPAKVTQGVTTELLGQDGLSYAPVDDTTLPNIRDRIRGWNGDPDDFEFTWRDVAGYLERLAAGAGCNAAYLVPHGNVRELAMGTRQGPASRAELARQRAVVRAGMEQGAFGMSAGLTYVPGMFAATGELVELCRVVARYDGLYVPHHRNYGSEVISGYAECFEIARRSGVRLHLAHAHLSWPVNEHRMTELLELFAQAERDGVDFSFDSYPYRAAMSTLSAQFPGWSQAGDLAERRRRFLDPATRRRLVAAVDRDGSDGHSGLVVDWSTIVIAGVPEGDWTWTTGRTVAAAAAQAGTDPAEFAIELLLGTGFSATCVMFIGFEANVRDLMRHPRHTVGTDGLLVGARVHPRAWGSFARVLGEYVRRAGVLTLPEAVRHMTSAPADRLRLPDRGRIAEGAFADLVVFDPDTVDSQADYEHPTVPATGVKDVWCNGVRTLQDGALTAAPAGRPLRSGSDPSRAPHRSG